MHREFRLFLIHSLFYFYFFLLVSSNLMCSPIRYLLFLHCCCKTLFFSQSHHSLLYLIFYSFQFPAILSHTTLLVHQTSLSASPTSKIAINFDYKRRNRGKVFPVFLSATGCFILLLLKHCFTSFYIK